MVVNFQSGTEDRITTPFSSDTSAGASTAPQDCSSWRSPTFTTATPATSCPLASAEER